MNRNQQDKLRKSLEGKKDTDEVIALIERSSDDKPACPKCKATKLYRWGKVSDLQPYRCCQCDRSTFNALTGTPLARLRHKDKWFEYEQTMIRVVVHPHKRVPRETCRLEQHHQLGS